MAALGINPGFLLIFLIYFIVVASVMTIWVYNPIINGLEARKKKIAQGLEDAKVAAEAKAKAQDEANKIIATAQQEANKRVAEATERAEKTAADIKVAAEADRKRILAAAAAEDDAKLERNRVLSELRGQIAGLAISAANKIVGEALDEKRQRALIEEFFSGVKAGKVVVAEGASFSGSAEVTSALPLSADEQATIKADLKVSDVTFHVDPAIMGGLIIRSGDKIVDGSVVGKLEGLRQSLK